MHYLFNVCFLFPFLVFGQNKKVADSLEVIYNSGNYKNADKLELLRNLAFNSKNDISKSLIYVEELIALAQQSNNYLYLYRGYNLKGQNLKRSGNLTQALDVFIKGSEAAARIKDRAFEGGSYLSIANIYSDIGNSANAEIYYKKSIEILRKSSDSLTLATSLLNAGDEAFNQKKYDQALNFFSESGFIFKKINYPIGTAYNYGNLGMVYAEQGKDQLAENNINKALEILKEAEDYYGISDYLTYMSDIYLRKKDFPTALSYAKRSLELATLYKLKEQVSSSNATLSKIYDVAGNKDAALHHYKEHIAFRDSLINLDNVQKMADLRTDFEVSQKQIEVDLAEQKRKNQQLVSIGIAAALLFMIILALLWYRRYLFIKKTKKIIEEERDKSDSLLLNILPVETATELKTYGKVKAKKYNEVTVLFSDFKGFTSYSQNLSPESLVETVDFYFSKFDTIIEKYGLEKIKTIGDAYMCAGGLHHNEGNENAHKMILAAQEITNFVEMTKNDILINDMSFDIRIGINTGPVVAGVVGTKKFAFDIWGDTVNVASRMESMSEPGKINISEATYNLVKEKFECEYRGEIEAKNRGKMKMYFVN